MNVNPGQCLELLTGENVKPPLKSIRELLMKWLIMFRCWWQLEISCLLSHDTFRSSILVKSAMTIFWFIAHLWITLLLKRFVFNLDNYNMALIIIGIHLCLITLHMNCVILWKINKDIWLTLWGLGTWNFTSPRNWALFGNFLFVLINQSFICHGSQFSSFFTILQEHMSLWPQCNIILGTTKFMMF